MFGTNLTVRYYDVRYYDPLEFFSPWGPSRYSVQGHLWVNPGIDLEFTLPTRGRRQP